MNPNDSSANSKLPANDECVPDRVSRFLSDQLGVRELERFEDHLVGCQLCQRQLNLSSADQEIWDEARSSLNSQSDDEADGLESSRSESGDYISRMVLDSLAPSDDPHMLGRLGPYEVSGVIGQGGMGVVLKGYDGALSRFVALKVLRPYLAVSGAARQRFFREAKAAATVNHDNVMPIHSVAEHNDLPYLVMPYVRGESLQQRVSKSGPLSAVEVVRIGMQIASGLAAAHAQGLVHRDIKPANIILEQGVEKLWITDFGLARLVDDASLTRTGVIAGTPEYMSPEQSRGDSVDERSDLFSLGSVMYAMCTGHPPFRADSSYGVLRRITDVQPRAIREINEQIPEWLDRLILQLLSKVPADRVATAGEIAELLKQSLAHLQHPTAFELPGPVKALVPKPAPARWKTMAWRIASLLALLALLVVGVQYSPILFGPASGPAKTGPESTTSAGAKTSPDSHLGPIAAANPVQDNKISSHQFLPANTHVWVSIPDVKRFQANFDKSQIGNLFNSEAMTPFWKSFENEFDELMTEKKLPFVFDLLEQEWLSGEVCFAFTDSVSVFPVAQLVGDNIQPVVMADVTGRGNQALKEIEAKFGRLPFAQQGPVKLPTGEQAVKTTYGPQNNRQTIYHVVANDWLIIGNDSQQLGNLVSHMIEGRGNKGLAVDPRFREAMSRSKIGDVEPDIQWFAKPLGVMSLLSRYRNVNSKLSPDDWVRVWKDQGLGVFSGVGGRIAFSTDDHEILHRCFVCQTHDGMAPAGEQLNRHKVLGLFDFINKDGDAVAPPRWVPTDVSSCLIANWDKSRALSTIGPVYDAFLQEPGAFERTLRDFKVDPDMRLDVEKFVNAFDRRTILMSHSEKPIDGKSEQLVLGFKVKGDPKFVMESMRRAVAGENFKLLGYEGVYATIRPETDLEQAGFEEPFALPGEKVNPDVVSPNRFYVMANDILFFSHDKELIKQLLEKRKNGTLVESEDYIQVHAALGKFTDTKRIGIRQFARLDLRLETSYELFRRGEFEWPEWLVKRKYSDDMKQLVVKRKQRFDGSALPKNYAKIVAPLLGLSGWVLENEDDGFLITGCVLKK